MCDSNAHSMDHTASTLTIQSLRLLSVPAILRCFNLNCKFKKCNKITKLSLAVTLATTNPDPNHLPQTFEKLKYIE